MVVNICFLAGEDLDAGDISAINIEDGRLYKASSYAAPDDSHPYLIQVDRSVKKGEAYEKTL
jgi:hypothetical protein